ncbi:MAG: magnesium/cobalt transporter CorA [Methanomicrobiaceae archaeon]|nr:magnesium/cobalt transporter CorA [Methanomicrobiaceae archaeon]
MTEPAPSPSAKAGMPPGSLVHIGSVPPLATAITLFRYSEKGITERKGATLAEVTAPLPDKEVTWIDCSGLGDIGAVEAIGARFSIHPLTLEDILNTRQRPKIEYFDHYIYVVLKMLALDDREIRTEQVSIILGEEFVLTFQEQEGDVFDPVRARLRAGGNRIRREGAGYLAYSLLDAVVDGYYAIFEWFGEEIEDLEDELLDGPGQRTLQAIHEKKRLLIMIRRSIWPLREVVGAFERVESPLVSGITPVYLRDVYDHTVELVETLETYRDMMSGMIDIHLSTTSNHMNEIMKVLTIIATIFIPLTFIAGLYGMNFVGMPELSNRYGYPAVLLLMLAVGLVEVWFFRKRGWL